jgi:hypothetical protein
MAGSAKVAAAPSSRLKESRTAGCRLARHLEADVLGEGHQADLDPFHEEHQTDDHRQYAERYGFGVEQGSAQGEGLKADQHQRQRHDCAQLLAEAHRNVGRQQTVQIDGPQPGGRLGCKRSASRSAAKLICRL